MTSRSVITGEQARTGWVQPIVTSPVLPFMLLSLVTVAIVVVSPTNGPAAIATAAVILTFLVQQLGPSLEWRHVTAVPVWCVLAAMIGAVSGLVSLRMSGGEVRAGVISLAVMLVLQSARIAWRNYESRPRRVEPGEDRQSTRELEPVRATS